MLAETTDRFIRHRAFHSIYRPNWQASDQQLEELKWAADGLRLMTHLHPDATPSEVCSYRIKRGQKYKSKGGHPIDRIAGYKKRRREELYAHVMWLRRLGWSQRQIAAKLNLPRSTVQLWIQAES